MAPSRFDPSRAQVNAPGHRSCRHELRLLVDADAPADGTDPWRFDVDGKCEPFKRLSVGFPRVAQFDDHQAGSWVDSLEDKPAGAAVAVAGLRLGGASRRSSRRLKPSKAASAGIHR